MAGSLCPTGGKGYGPESGEEDFAAFRAWLRCYGVPGMSSLRDRRGRTIWFQVWGLISRIGKWRPRKLVGEAGQESWGLPGDVQGLSRPPRVTLCLVAQARPT